VFEIRILRTPSDKALLRKEQLADGFNFFDPKMVEHRTYVVVLEAGQPVGLAALVESSMRIPGALGVGYVETHRAHRQRGIAKLLVEGLFGYALESGKDIANTEYEPDGLKWLKPLMQSAAQRSHQVRLFERT
jgi:GNAT superfamily N-acetyltransferase